MCVALLLGKPPKSGTVVAEVRGLLAEQGVDTQVVLPHLAEPGSTVGRVVAEVAGADLVVHRGLTAQDEQLLEALAARAVPLCNPCEGVRHTRDRGVLHEALLTAGIPTPRGRSVQTWAEVLELAVDQPVVAKMAGTGRGTGVLAGVHPETRAADGLSTAGTPGRQAGQVAELASSRLPVHAPGGGPYLVERLVLHDGVDRKLYVAGDRVHGLLKPSTLLGEHTTEGDAFDVPAELRDLALATAAALELHLCGIDVIVSAGDASKYLVVDVNPFPGYRSVAGAAQSVADHVLSHLKGSVA